MADTTVFFGNVAFRAEDDDLRRLVETVAPVKSCRIITDKMSGASRGFAFVELQLEGDVEKVILELNGRDLWGRALRVARGRTRVFHSKEANHEDDVTCARRMACRCALGERRYWECCSC